MKDGDDIVISSHHLGVMNLSKLQQAYDNRKTARTKVILVGAAALLLAWPCGHFLVRPLIGGDLPTIIYALPILLVFSWALGTGLKLNSSMNEIHDEMSTR